MEKSFRSGQFRRGKYFSYRNINVCHTIFKDSLLCRVLYGHQCHSQISPVGTSSLNVDRSSFIQRIDDRLLDSLIGVIVQCIDLHSLRKDLFKMFANIRYREGNNGKAPLLTRNIFIGHLACLTV